MAVISRFCLMVFSIAVLLSGCKSKKKPSLSGEDPVEVSDLIDFFPEARLPYSIADTFLSKKDNDSLLISFKVFSQFVPDSVSRLLFGKGVKPRIYPLGKAKSERKDTYLLAKAVAGNTKTAFIFIFNKSDQFITAMQLLQPDKLSATSQTVVIDRKLTISKTISRENSDGSVSEGKDVYTFSNESKELMLIMTDPLDDKITERVNPIDTLPRKQKYTADYGTGKMNLVSIRDSKKKGKLTFFIHFEKNNGSCTGELRGDAVVKSPTIAEYREPGDPCGLQFIFSSTSVTLKELGACGAHRGLRCSFDGRYPRKREVKPKTAK